MPVITVSQLNNYMKRYVEQNIHLSDLWVKGEISNFKHHYSGHYYFTIKDENSSLKCVMFKSYVSQIKFIPADGMKVIVFGKLSVYEQGGIYQLYSESMIPDGAGELYAAYEQLKNRLDNEGYFSPERKRSLPKFPQKIGIVTSISGAALRDILNVIKRRYPIVDICIYPAKVQGIGASDSICSGINYFSDSKDCDVVIIARGGGSIEDLWAFNEEKTANAIFSCKIPVVSGVGHETDFTISDFVADVRAPTPSAAAEIVVPSIDEINQYITQYRQKAAYFLNSKLGICELLLKKYSFDLIKLRLDSKIDLYYQTVNSLIDTSCTAVTKILDNAKLNLSKNLIKLETLNPLSVLSRGYSVVLDESNRVFDIKKAQKGDFVAILTEDGRAEGVLRRVIYEKKESNDI